MSPDHSLLHFLPVFICFIVVLVAIINLAAVIHWNNECVAQTTYTILHNSLELLTKHNDAIRNCLGPWLHSFTVEATERRANLVNNFHVNLHPFERFFRIDAVEDADHVYGSEGNEMRRI